MLVVITALLLVFSGTLPAWAEESADDDESNLTALEIVEDDFDEGEDGVSEPQVRLMLPQPLEIMGAPSPVYPRVFLANEVWRSTDYTGAGLKTFKAPYTGNYEFYLNGASGGHIYINGPTYWKGDYPTYIHAFSGGRTFGTVKLSKNQTVYIAVGGKGGDITFDGWSGGLSGSGGGWNGGGSGGSGTGRDIDPDSSYFGGTGGGGCTTLMTTKRGGGELTNYGSHKGEVLLVAGGSGGVSLREGGDGGGANGGDALQPWVGPTGTHGATGGSQSSAGNGGGFGYGGNGRGADHSVTDSAREGAGGGGGGWYGGGGTTDVGQGTSLGGGGGSGYIASGKVENGAWTHNGEGSWDSDGAATVRWDVHYKVTFKKNFTSATGSMSDKIYKVDDNSPNLPSCKFKCQGYEVAGWSTNKKCSPDNPDIALGASVSKINPGVLNSPTITLYALWKPLEASGGFFQNADESDTTSEKVTFTYDQSGQHFQTTKAFKKTGYIQTGWSTKRQQNNTIDIKSTEWSSINGQPLKVDKQSNRGGTLLTPDAPNEMEDILDEEGKKIGEKIKDPPGERPINKWILAHQGGFEFYATWEPKSYKLQFFHNGGANWDGQQMFERTVYYDHTWYNELTREATAEQEMNPNKKFLGYYSAASGGQQVYDEYGLAVNSEDWFLDGLWHRDIEQDTIFLYAHWG